MLKLNLSLGYGRRCQRIVRAITELAGIENIRCKIVGRTTPLTVVRCTFQGLQMQVTGDYWSIGFQSNRNKKMLLEIFSLTTVEWFSSHLPSRHSLVQSPTQGKYQNNVSNLFKLSNKDTRANVVSIVVFK